MFTHARLNSLKRSDDFDSPAFSAWIEGRLDILPTSSDASAALAQRLGDEAKAARSAMDEWEVLGIDWENFHPKARQILDSPFLWDCTDNFSPNGNDTGVDVLSLYSEWRRKTKSAPATTSLDQLMSDWGITAPYPSDDETMNVLWEEAKNRPRICPAEGRRALW